MTFKGECPLIELRLFYIAVILIFMIGVRLVGEGFFSNSLTKQVRYRKDAAYRIISLKEDLLDRGIDPLFLKLGLKVSMRRYMAIRKIMLSAMLLLSILKACEADYRHSLLLFLIMLLALRLSSPKLQNNKGKKTFFAGITDMALKRRNDRLDEELTGIIIQMKNIIISKKTGISAVYILTRLIPFTNLSKDAFTASLRYVRQGKMAEAASAFSMRFGTKLGEAFSRVILNLDSLPPAEFLEQLTNLQKTAMEQHNTRKEKHLMNMQNLKRSLAYLEALLVMGIFIYLITADSLKILNTLN